MWMHATQRLRDGRRDGRTEDGLTEDGRGGRDGRRDGRTADGGRTDRARLRRRLDGLMTGRTDEQRSTTATGRTRRGVLPSFQIRHWDRNSIRHLNYTDFSVSEHQQTFPARDRNPHSISNRVIGLPSLLDKFQNNILVSQPINFQ